MASNLLMREGKPQREPHAKSSPGSPEVAERQRAKEIKCQGET